MREFGAFLRGQQKRAMRARVDALWAAWHVAAFSRSKKIPDLAPLLRKVGGVAKRATPEEMLAKVRMINRALGGKVTPRTEKVAS